MYSIVDHLRASSISSFVLPARSNKPLSSAHAPSASATSTPPTPTRFTYVRLDRLLMKRPSSVDVAQLDAPRNDNTSNLGNAGDADRTRKTGDVRDTGDVRNSCDAGDAGNMRARGNCADEPVESATRPVTLVHDERTVLDSSGDALRAHPAPRARKRSRGRK